MESKRASGEQFIAILEFMERYGDLSRCQPGPHSKIRAMELWKKLAKTVNSVRGGVSRPPDKWKKVWADWKSKTKKKAFMLRRHNNIAGEVPRSRLLTTTETRVLRVTGVLNPKEQFDSVLPASDLSSFVIDIGVDDVPVSLPSTSETILTPSGVKQFWTIPILPQVKQTQTILTQSEVKQPQSVAKATQSEAKPTQHVAKSSKSNNHKTIQMNAKPETPQRCRVFPLRRRSALRFTDGMAIRFLAIEKRRLRLEERREMNAARRLEVEHQRNDILNRFADIAETYLQHLQKSPH